MPRVPFCYFVPSSLPVISTFMFAFVHSGSCLHLRATCSGSELIIFRNRLVLSQVHCQQIVREKIHIRFFFYYPSKIMSVSK